MRILLAAVLFLSGCAGVSVERRGESQYAPSNEARGGRVRYRAGGPGLHGAQVAVNARRENAYKEMYTQCGGNNYRIVAEWDESGGQVTAVQANRYGSHANGTAASFGLTDRLIDFECGAAQAAVQ